MRGDLALQLRVALRRRGVVGMAAMAAGVAGIASVYLPWYEVRVDVAMLGGHDSGALTALPGWQSQPWIWAVAALATIAVVVGLAVAADRPFRHGGELLMAVAVALAAVVGASALVTPPRVRFGADETLQRWLAMTVPDDVAIGFSVHPAPGVWVALAASALLLVAAFASREV